MKKLFFAAAIAIVAVGGALTSQAEDLYTFGAPEPNVFCPGEIGNCLTDGPYGDIPVYTEPAGPNQAASLVNLEDYSYDL